MKVDEPMSLEQQFLVDRVGLLAAECARLREQVKVLAECVLRDRFGVGKPPWEELKRLTGYRLDL